MDVTLLSCGSTEKTMLEKIKKGESRKATSSMLLLSRLSGKEINSRIVVKMKTKEGIKKTIAERESLLSQVNCNTPYLQLSPKPTVATSKSVTCMNAPKVNKKSSWNLQLEGSERYRA